MVIVCGWMVLKAAAGDIVIITAVSSNLLAVMVYIWLLRRLLCSRQLNKMV